MRRLRVEKDYKKIEERSVEWIVDRIKELQLLILHGHQQSLKDAFNAEIVNLKAELGRRKIGSDGRSEDKLGN
jgi:hypothetical protein